MTNEELAVRIQAGENEREYMGILWARYQGYIRTLALRYMRLIENHAFIDFEDALQCGYFAIKKAVQRYKPEKGFMLITYIDYRFRTEMYIMFGGFKRKTAEGQSYSLPPPTFSLDAPLDASDPGADFIDMLEDDKAGHIEHDYERGKTLEAVSAAVERLPEKQRYVIREHFYRERELQDLVDGQLFTKYSQVQSAKATALMSLQRDAALRVAYYGHY